MIERMDNVMEELIVIFHEMEEKNYPKPIIKKMDTIVGKFENLLYSVEAERRAE